MPIYKVTVESNPPRDHVVEANTKAGAINHVIRNLVTANPMTAAGVLSHMRAGGTVETVQVEDANVDAQLTLGEAETKTPTE